MEMAVRPDKQVAHCRGRCHGSGPIANMYYGTYSVSDSSQYELAKGQNQQTFMANG
jgi:hypothetical protein